jgi:hypothetical protein
MQEMTNAPVPPQAADPKEEQKWAMLCHAASFAGFVIPFGNVLGPLLVWLLKGEGMPFVDAQGKEAINFQLTMTIVYFVGILLIIVLIGILLIVVAAVVSVILTIIAMVNASGGTAYRYPLTIRFVK